MTMFALLFSALALSAGETPALPENPEKKSIEDLAKEVIAGKWGNGTDRKDRLTEAGYNYREVQDKVNELLQ